MKSKKNNLFDKKYKDAILISFLYQIFLLLLAGMILDGGQFGQFIFVAMAGFWGSVFVLIRRKRWNPSKSDILYVKWGFFLILVFVPFIMNFAWYLRGIK